MDDYADRSAEQNKLKEKIAELEAKLKKTEDELKVSLRRYDIAMSFSDVTVFDYNTKTKKILTQPVDFEIFGMPGVMEQGVEELLSMGIIAERSKEDMRKLYRSIDNGSATASATIYANTLGGEERTILLQMVTIFDEDGKPNRAVGVRKDITDAAYLQKEKKFSDLLSSDLTFIYEANATRNKILRSNKLWATQIGLGETTALSEMVQLMCDRFIAPEDVALFQSKLSKSSILSAFQKDERIIVFEYRKHVENEGFLWFEARINLVQDEITGDINMRVYIINIDKKKKNEMKLTAQRKRYELALSKSAIVYGINLTKGVVDFGHEKLQDRFGVPPNERDFENVAAIALRSIHFRDRAAMSKLWSCKNLLQAFASGKTEQFCDYQILDKQEKYGWFRCTMQLFEEEQTADVLSYAYIEDINEEKEKELALIYKAQHDQMTGFYNKNATEEKINEILSSEEGKQSAHIFFIIDLDYFKLANDQFGHAFGDSVLSRTAAQIASLFRMGDILGRIGGDEFVVFMKNVQNDDIASLKAQEICDRVSESYLKDDTEYKVTASIGIAVYNRHGSNYDALYRHSDMALYNAKELGRNCFAIYHEEMKSKQDTTKKPKAELVFQKP